MGDKTQIQSYLMILYALLNVLARASQASFVFAATMSGIVAI